MSCVRSLLSSLLLSLCLTYTTVEASTFTTPYSHYSDNEALASVLSDFARQQNMTPRVSEQIKGVISGRFNNVDPNNFIEALASAFGVHFYSLHSFLNFYHESEMTRRFYKPSHLSCNALLNELHAAQMIAPELPLRLQNGSLVISGPTSYADDILAFVSDIDKDDEPALEIRVFKLKHAKAEDITISNSERVMTIPGMATVLRNLLSGISDPSAPTVSFVSNKVPGLSGSAEEKKPEPAAKASTTNVQNVHIIADTRLNAVLIQDAADRMPFYEAVIEQLDQPVQLIELHAAIVDVDVDSAQNLGIDWQAGYKNDHVNGNIGVKQELADTTGGIISTIFSDGRSSFMMQINALEKDNKAHTLGRPSLLTMDNLEATLEDTTTRYIPIAGFQDTDLFKVEFGTVLRVTPHIIDDGQDQPLIQMVITLQSNQENSASMSQDVGSTTVPPIKQTKINTQAIVRQGQSVLLGGYYVEYAGGSNKGVPGLKDAPLIGGLFGTDAEDTYTRERLLLITPRILSLEDMTMPRQLTEHPFAQNALTATYEHTSAPVISPEKTSGCSSSRNAQPQPQVQQQRQSLPQSTDPLNQGQQQPYVVSYKTTSPVL